MERQREGCLEYQGCRSSLGAAHRRNMTPGKVAIPGFQCVHGARNEGFQIGSGETESLERFQTSTCLGHRHGTETGHSSEDKGSTRNGLIQFPSGVLLQEQNEIVLRKQRNVVCLPY